MSAEWELLALAAHASHHWLGQLKWLSDIDRLSRIREIRWDQAVAKARRFGWMRMLSVVCGVTRRLYGSPIPDEAAADPLPPWVATFPAPAPADPHDSVRRESRYIPDLRSRASFLAKVVFSPTPREEALVPLPRSLDVLYLGIRPACLAGRWLAGRS
jgi:hypothetical protein